jgi:DNA-binding SARP family transcriptional activator
VAPPTSMPTSTVSSLVPPRVTALLPGTGTGPLSLVVAPAGYGKSLLLAHHAQSFPGQVITWRPYRDASEPASLLDRLLRQLAPPGPPAAGRSRPATVESVLEAVERHAIPVLIVVDDVHLIHGNPVEAALGELALLAPANLRITLSGRRRPAISLARLELSGTTVVTAGDLTFRREEIRQALALAGPQGWPLVAGELTVLGRLTQGWPVALRLCVQAPRRGGVRAVTPADTVLSSAAVRSYLDREVLGVLPPDLVRAFAWICQSSEDRWLTDDGSGVLDELDEGYGLVRRHGSGRYDCVPLLAAHLRRRAATAPAALAAPARSPAAAAYPSAAPPDTPRAPLSLRCFGRFEATSGDHVLGWGTTRPRVRALARLLAVHAGQPVHRERLMAALWPDSPERTACRGLQVAVSALRTFLEPGMDRGRTRILVRSGEAYMISLPPGGACDVQRFDTAVTAGLRAAAHGAADQAADCLGLALRLYTGELLPEDGPAEWVVPLREQYRARAVRAALTLAELELARDRPQAAVAAALHALSADPFQDAVHRLLITGHRRAGDPVAAHHAAQRHARMLDELGVVPAPSWPAPPATSPR